MSGPDASQTARTVFEGVKVHVDVVSITGRDGRSYERELVVHPGAVIVLPILDDGRIVLIRNHRFAVGKTLWELPAGTLEAGEDPALCAGRELIEETGYQSDVIEKLSAFYTTPGISTELMHAFRATGLKHVGQALEETEQIEVEPRPYDDVLNMIRQNVIEDGKTIATILYDHACRPQA